MCREPSLTVGLLTPAHEEDQGLLLLRCDWGISRMAAQLFPVNRLITLIAASFSPTLYGIDLALSTDDESNQYCRSCRNIPHRVSDHVSISFDCLQALSDVSFSLRSNEMLFLTGASGSGKSVLLRLAMGLLRPDEGQILCRDGR